MHSVEMELFNMLISGVCPREIRDCFRCLSKTVMIMLLMTNAELGDVTKLSVTGREALKEFDDMLPSLSPFCHWDLLNPTLD